MKKNFSGWIIAVIAVAVVVFLVYSKIARNNKPGPLDGFTQCLKDKGAIFYGAFWCPNCQNQKTMFGNSKRLLPYIECSTPDGQAQLKDCREKNVEGYPTWEFSDGGREVGVLSLETLAEKTGCELPK